MWDSISTDSCDVCQFSPPRSKKGEATFHDKENLPQGLSPGKGEDVSFYGNTSLSLQPALCTGTSPNHCNHNNIITRRPLEDHDPNSRDSGYITNYGEKFSTYASLHRAHSFESASIGSMEDEFLEDFSDIEPLEDNLPRDFSKLITGPIGGASKEKFSSPKDAVIRPLLRRALSLQNESTTPNSSKVRSCLFKITSGDARPFKRPEPPLDDTPTNSKKAKLFDDVVPSLPFIRPLLQRAFSATEESIKCAVQRSSTDPDLIGDFSKTFCLPLTSGKHQDLKSITPDTLAQLIKGEFSANVESFKVIDCRYPYEFEGGHIQDAVNVYTREQCAELLNNPGPEDVVSKKRNILVFHCEFSSERGPNLCRYLRQQDRQVNQEVYPSLHYPELYLLEGGYKSFFAHFSNLCVPVAYKEMLHPEHEEDLRYFRLKSKTWNVDTRATCRPYKGGVLKRLGL